MPIWFLLYIKKFIASCSSSSSSYFSFSCNYRTYLIERFRCVDDFLCSMLVCLWPAVDWSDVFVVLLHCNRLHRRNAFAAYANRVCQCNQHHLRPLLVDYWARTHFFQGVRWFCAPTLSTDAPNAKYLTVKRPNATVVIPNCFSMRTQADHSLRRSFHAFNYKRIQYDWRSPGSKMNKMHLISFSFVFFFFLFLYCACPIHSFIHLFNAIT